MRPTHLIYEWKMPFDFMADQVEKGHENCYNPDAWLEAYYATPFDWTECEFNDQRHFLEDRRELREKRLDVATGSGVPQHIPGDLK
jgi:hypothetical protein